MELNRYEFRVLLYYLSMSGGRLVRCKTFLWILAIFKWICTILFGDKWYLSLRMRQTFGEGQLITTLRWWWLIVVKSLSRSEKSKWANKQTNKRQLFKRITSWVCYIDISRQAHFCAYITGQKSEISFISTIPRGSASSPSNICSDSQPFIAAKKMLTISTAEG